MRRAEKLAYAIVGAALGGVVATTDAGARICGDADGNFDVTVSDGVQVLRSAAGLASKCVDNPRMCDIDGDGAATVTDGVNVLRKAAQLAIAEACPSGATADVQAVSDVVVPFLTQALHEAHLVFFALPSGAPVSADACEEGGTRTISAEGETATVRLDACVISQPGFGTFRLDGTIHAPRGDVGAIRFDLALTDLGAETVTAFAGVLQGRVAGGLVVDGGPLIVRGASARPEIFRLRFDGVGLDERGNAMVGTVAAEDTSERFHFRSAEFRLLGRTAARVRVVDDEVGMGDYLLDVQTGDLLPWSGVDD